jgi:hypothetical protein
MEYDAQLGFYDKAPVPWAQLTQQQICDIATEHVLDWLLDNDDARASNFLRTTTGRIIGVDKGRAFVSYGHWNGLSGTASADERCAVIYTSLYAAIRSGEVNRDIIAMAARDSALDAAARAAAVSDVLVAEIVSAANSGRPEGKFGDAPGNCLAGLVSAVLARKALLLTEFAALWDTLV